MAKLIKPDHSKSEIALYLVLPSLDIWVITLCAVYVFFMIALLIYLPNMKQTWENQMSVNICL